MAGYEGKASVYFEGNAEGSVEVQVAISDLDAPRWVGIVSNAVRLSPSGFGGPVVVVLLAGESKGQSAKAQVTSGSEREVILNGRESFG